MAHGNLVLLLLCLFSTSCYSFNQFVQCPNHEGCKCDEKEIICDCSTASTIYSSRKTVIVSENTSPTTERLIIKNCEVAILNNYTLTSVGLKHIEFTNIGNMSIYHLGINLINNLDLIRFKDINRLLLGRFAVAYITNLKRFEIINVTSPGFPLTAFFELDGIEEFLIENSNIGVLKSHAITARNGSSFIISNSNFSTLSNASILVKNFEQFIIKDSFIENWLDYGIGSLNAGQIQFKRNTVNSTGKGFLYVSGAAELIMRDNEFRFLKSGALDEIFRTSYISFMDNRITEAMPNSIADYFNYTSKKVKVVAEGNEFRCGCGIEWITLNMTGNLQFLRDNVCISPFSTISIPFGSLTFVHDSDGNCLSFVEPEFTRTVSTTQMVNHQENADFDNNIPDTHSKQIFSNTSRLSDSVEKIPSRGADTVSVKFLTMKILLIFSFFVCL